MGDPINFLVVGVGGQGTILVSDILAEAGMEAGYDAKKSDVLGLAVRGGSVSSHVRWGRPVGSPMCMKGGVHYLLAFEPLEAIRAAEYLGPDATVVMNNYKLPPMLVSTGQAEYPSDERITAALTAAGARLIRLDATAVARQIGNVKTMNLVLLGVLSGLLDADYAVWSKVIAAYVPDRYLDINMKAFCAGRSVRL